MSNVTYFCRQILWYTAKHSQDGYRTNIHYDPLPRQFKLSRDHMHGASDGTSQDQRDAIMTLIIGQGRALHKCLQVAPYTCPEIEVSGPDHPVPDLGTVPYLPDIWYLNIMAFLSVQCGRYVRGITSDPRGPWKAPIPSAVDTSPLGG